METNYESILSSFAGIKVIVIGDLIIDVYSQGEPLGVSAETPTLVIKHESSRFSVGGAGLLVRNMLALGGHVIFITLTGGDEYAKQEKNLSHPNLKKIIIRDSKRVTTVKERFWSGGYKLLTWDRLDNRPISSFFEIKIINFVKKNLKSSDKLIVSDYRHGLITKTLVEKLIRLAKNYKKPIYVDSQISQSEGNHLWYQGADLFCLNKKEAESIDKGFNENEAKKSLARLQKILKTKNIIVKLGGRGTISLFGSKFIKTFPFKIKASDTTGAGDAFFAVIALGKNLTENELKIANIWAALSTTIAGTEPPKKQDIINALKNDHE